MRSFLADAGETPEAASISLALSLRARGPHKRCVCGGHWCHAGDAGVCHSLPSSLREEMVPGMLLVLLPTPTFGCRRCRHKMAQHSAASPCGSSFPWQGLPYECPALPKAVPTRITTGAVGSSTVISPKAREGFFCAGQALLLGIGEWQPQAADAGGGGNYRLSPLAFPISCGGQNCCPSASRQRPFTLGRLSLRSRQPAWGLKMEWCTLLL